MDGMQRRAWLIGAAIMLMAANKPRRRRRAAPVAPPETRPAPPPVDVLAPRIAPMEPAPVPRTDLLPPSGDRAPHTSLEIGVPSVLNPVAGQTFQSSDPTPERRLTPQNRLPVPGATLRVPF